MSCTFSGLNTAPFAATANITSMCSAQLYSSVDTRWSPSMPRSLCRACAKAAARAPISANVVSSAPDARHVVHFVVAWAVVPNSKILATENGTSCIVESMQAMLARA